MELPVIVGCNRWKGWESNIAQGQYCNIALGHLHETVTKMGFNIAQGKYCNIALGHLHETAT